MSTKNFVSYGDAETLFSEVGNKIKNLDYGKLNVCSTLPRNPIPGALYVAANWDESGSYPYNGRIYQYRLVLSTSQIDNTWKPVYLAKNIYYSLANGGSSDFKVGSYLFGSTPGKDAYGYLRLDVCAVVSRIYNDVMGITYADLTKLDASGKPNSYTDTINDVGGGFSSTSYYGKMMWMEVGEKLSIVSNVYNLPPYSYNPNDVVLYTGQDYTDIKNLLWTKGHIYQCIDKNGNWTDITPVSSGGGTKYYVHHVAFGLVTPNELYAKDSNCDAFENKATHNRYVVGASKNNLLSNNWDKVYNDSIPILNWNTPQEVDYEQGGVLANKAGIEVTFLSPDSTPMSSYSQFLSKASLNKLILMPKISGNNSSPRGYHIDEFFNFGGTLNIHVKESWCTDMAYHLNDNANVASIPEMYLAFPLKMIRNWTDTVTEWTA